MANVILKLLIVILTNAGGTGKTHFTEILECLARLAGMSVSVVDADQGCRGYRNRNGSSNGTVLDWSVGGLIPADWFNQHLAPVDVGLIDLGANFLSIDTPASAFLNDIVEIARSQNIRTVFLPIDSPDKAGARALAERLYSQFSNTFEVCIVRNDNRGTDNFGSAVRIIDPPTLQVPFLAAGYESVRLRQQRRLDEVINAPEEGYAIASAAMAHRLLQVARDPIIERLLGTAMRAPLEAAAQGHLSPLRFTIVTPADAQDEKLRANKAARLAQEKVYNSADADPQVRLAAFEAEHEAVARYYAC